MSATHTPGPWSIGPWIDSMGEHVYRVITHEGRRVSAISVYGRKADGSHGGRPLKGGGCTKSVSSEECDANARLIAAAPDLLATLKCARVVVARSAEAGTCPAGLLASIDAAIARATMQEKL